ncbi:MAG TPA: methyltransferase domain-containing protein [Thermoanaerobaculia bacterium]|nr:methyltransferase domain-containing protein [Thermoanaerobaculia bacterium]
MTDIVPGTADLRAEIARLGPWHHDVEVSDGIRTGDVVRTPQRSAEFGEVSLIRPDRILPRVLADVYPAGLAGRSMLDCACNAGGYLFAAADLGAGRGFGFDARDHWIRQAQFLRAHRPAQNIEFAQCALADLPGLHLEPFDITLFQGIFYHLPDPVAGLRIAADHTRELLVFNTAATWSRNEGLILNLESDQDVMSGVNRLAWLPTSPHVLQEILAWCGLPESRIQLDERVGAQRRIQILAARDNAIFASYDAAPRPEAGRLRRFVRR